MVNAYKAIYRRSSQGNTGSSESPNKHTHPLILFGGHKQTSSIFHWRHEIWQQVHWCDPGLRGWSVGRSPPGDPGWLKSTYKHPHPLVWAGWFLFRWPENKVSRTNGIYLVSEECCPSCTDCFIIGSIWFRKHGKSFTKWDPKRCSCSSFIMTKKTQCALRTYAHNSKIIIVHRLFFGESLKG